MTDSQLESLQFVPHTTVSPSVVPHTTVSPSVVPHTTVSPSAVPHTTVAPDIGSLESLRLHGVPVAQSQPEHRVPHTTF